MRRRDVAPEMLRRRRAKRSLAEYALSIDIPGKPVGDDDESWIFEPVETSLASHHLLMLQAMERAMSTRYGRLMVFLPPGSAKSTYGSVVAPTWIMGKIPEYKIILSSYGSDLSRRHGRRARQLVKQDKFTSTFATEISKATSAADEWALSNGSEYLACGLLSGITGNRAHGLIIDDPIKGRKEAESETIRESSWQAYKDDLCTRLIPGGWIVLIQTRWHEDDIAGRLLPKGYDGRSGSVQCTDGHEWEILNLPAMCERDDDPLGREIGEYIWPEWFDEKHWMQFRKDPRTWASLFQQRPSPEEGTIFKIHWWKYYHTPPRIRWIMQSWDTGFKTKKDSAYSCCETWGITDNGYYLLDVYREKLEYPDLKRQLKTLYAKFKPRVVLVEDKASGQSLVQEIRRGTTIPVMPVQVTDGDKVLRAKLVSPMVEAGLCYLPEGAPWVADFVDEHGKFPGGKYADQVDTTSQALDYLGQKVGGIITGAKVIGE